MVQDIKYKIMNLVYLNKNVLNNQNATKLYFFNHVYIYYINNNYKIYFFKLFFYTKCI